MALKDLEAQLDAGYGIYGGGTQVRWATLLFAPDAAQWVAHEEWHPRQKARWLDDGRYELQVPYSDATEIAMDVLRHGDNVLVSGDKLLVTPSPNGWSGPQRGSADPPARRFDRRPSEEDDESQLEGRHDRRKRRSP